VRREKKYRAAAEDFAAHLLRASREGDATRLAYDQPGTWSIKYNLVWDRLLGLGLFSEAEMRREHAFYRTQLRPYGVPLDNRSTLTKPEWALWAASLADDPAFFADMVERIVRYANNTRNRVPLSDLYLTDTGRKIGFQARFRAGRVVHRLPGEALNPSCRAQRDRRGVPSAARAGRSMACRARRY
jgi:hypothetical protein